MAVTIDRPYLMKRWDVTPPVAEILRLLGYLQPYDTGIDGRAQQWLRLVSPHFYGLVVELQMPKGPRSVWLERDLRGFNMIVILDKDPPPSEEVPAAFEFRHPRIGHGIEERVFPHQEPASLVALLKLIPPNTITKMTLHRGHQSTEVPNKFWNYVH